MTATPEAIELARTAARAAVAKKALDPVAFDVSERLAITDLFLIITATNERQVGAVVDGIEEALLAVDRKPVRREGDRENRWVLLDYLDVVVHVQHSEERTLYALEKLWKDCPRVDLGDLEPAPEGGVTAGQVIVLRHGITDWNDTGRFQGQADVPLNAEGLAQAREAADALAGRGITQDRQLRPDPGRNDGRDRRGAAGVAGDLRRPPARGERRHLVGPDDGGGGRDRAGLLRSPRRGSRLPAVRDW